jgi:hypothetical protein
MFKKILYALIAVFVLIQFIDPAKNVSDDRTLTSQKNTLSLKKSRTSGRWLATIVTVTKLKILGMQKCNPTKCIILRIV